MLPLRFLWLLENFEKPGIYFGSLNPGNSLEFCVKTLNPIEICERHKNRSTQTFFFSLNFILFCHQLLFSKIIDTCLEYCIDQKYLEINGRSCLKSYLHIIKLQQFSKSTLENVLLVP